MKTRLLVVLLTYIVVALLTQNLAVTLSAGTIAGAFVFMITWAVQLAVENKDIPVEKSRVKNKKRRSFGGITSPSDMMSLDLDLDCAGGHED